ncbi:AAEL008808-PA [Aedes aegypti]|uniref:AAEL008808-PA n=1 Tax=Aedes aegypti TaxID=7159 RepID=Q16XR2_AEDAE|nr:AAEL008808-PA [Aedes aegypti]
MAVVKKHLKIPRLLSPTPRNVWITCGFCYKLGKEDRAPIKPYNPPASTCNKLGCTRCIFRIRSCSRMAHLKRKVKTRLDFQLNNEDNRCRSDFFVFTCERLNKS